MKTIHLGGVLGEKFGTTWELDVPNAKKACEALSRLVDGFEMFMLTAKAKGIEFAIYHGKNNNIGMSELGFSTEATNIFIEPVVGGAKNGVLQTVIGAVLVVAGVVMTFIPGAQPFAPSVIAAGVGLMIGGVSLMLMPKVDSSDSNSDGNKANKGFGGAVTTVASGVPVPLQYGEVDEGGFIISGIIRPQRVT